MAVSYDRTPFPYSMFETAGGGFAIGVIATSPYHFIKAPIGARLPYMAMMAPRSGGSFAVWSALYETMSAGVAHVRRKEDPWNSILAGGLTAALFSIRKGFRPAFNQFLLTGAFFACYEGVMIMNNRQLAASAEMHQSQSTYTQYSLPSPVPEAKNSEPGWFRRRFGRWMDDNAGQNNKGDVSNKTTVLESVDTLPPPMPTFNFQ